MSILGSHVPRQKSGMGHSLAVYAVCVHPCMRACVWFGVLLEAVWWGLHGLTLMQLLQEISYQSNWQPG